MTYTREEAEKFLTKARNLSERAAVYATKYTLEAETVASEVLSLQAAIRDAIKQGKETLGKNADSDIGVQVLRRAEGIIKGREGPGGDLRRLLPTKHRELPVFIRLFLGTRVKAQMIAKEDAQAIKEEYHAFRGLMALVFTLWPLAILAIPLLFGGTIKRSDIFWPGHVRRPPPGGAFLMLNCQLLLVGMIYFYTAVSIREAILKVNGSNIRTWWSVHHYITIGALFVLLTLPVDSPAVLGFIKPFCFMVLQQGIVMLLYNRYTRRRLYTRIALGKASVMEVVAGESSGTSGQLKILYPLLFCMQGYQGYVGSLLMLLHWGSFFNRRGWATLDGDQRDLRGGRGAFFLGSVFLLLALGNFSNTLGTFLAKRKLADAYKRQTKGRATSKASIAAAQGGESPAAVTHPARPAPIPGPGPASGGGGAGGPDAAEGSDGLDGGPGAAVVKASGAAGKRTGKKK